MSFIDKIRPKKAQLKLALTSTNPQRLGALAKSKHPEVREAAGARAFELTPLDVLLASYNNDKSYEGRTRARILEHPRIQAQLTMTQESKSADELAELASSPIYEIRLAVAKNRNTSTETLSTLGEDILPLWQQIGKNCVREAVAEHPNTSPATLESLIRDTISKEMILRLVPELENQLDMIFTNPNADQLIFHEPISSNPELNLRGVNLTGNGQDMIKRIVRSHSIVTARQAATNPNTPAQAVAHYLLKFGLSKDYIERINDAREEDMDLLTGVADYRRGWDSYCPGSIDVVEKLEDINKILDNHQQQRTAILDLIEQANPALHETLTFGLRELQRLADE